MSNRKLTKEQVKEKNAKYHAKYKDRDNNKKRKIAKLQKDMTDILIKNNINNPTKLREFLRQAKQKGMIIL